MTCVQSFQSKGTSRSATVHRQPGLAHSCGRAAVSSFAYQGTNAHCILGTDAADEAAPDPAAAVAEWERRRFWFQVLARLWPTSPLRLLWLLCIQLMPLLNAMQHFGSFQA